MIHRVLTGINHRYTVNSEKIGVIPLGHVLCLVLCFVNQYLLLATADVTSTCFEYKKYSSLIYHFVDTNYKP